MSSRYALLPMQSEQWEMTACDCFMFRAELKTLWRHGLCLCCWPLTRILLSGELSLMRAVSVQAPWVSLFPVHSHVTSSITQGNWAGAYYLRGFQMEEPGTWAPRSAFWGKVYTFSDLQHPGISNSYSLSVLWWWHNTTLIPSRHAMGHVKTEPE